MHLHRLIVNDIGDRVRDSNRLRDPASRHPDAVCLRAGIMIDQAGNGVLPSTEKRLCLWIILLYPRNDRHGGSSTVPWDLNVCAYKEKVSVRAENKDAEGQYPRLARNKSLNVKKC